MASGSVANLAQLSSEAEAAGGAANITAPPCSFQTSVTERRPTGGLDSVVLGSDSNKDVFDLRQAEREKVIDTPGAALRFPQAPGGDESVVSVERPQTLCRPVGGTATIVLSSDFEDAVEPSEATRAPVGGLTSVVLGTDDTKKVFASHQAQREAVIETPNAAPRFTQAPGGDESDQTADLTLRVKGPIGGQASVVLGSDSTKELFDQRHADRTALIETPDAAPRFPQAPGGAESSKEPLVPVTMRGPVGGVTNVVLGNDSIQEVYMACQEQRDATVATPAAAPRFSQAPGGDESRTYSDIPPSTRGSVGGTVSVVLGKDNMKDVFDELQANRDLRVETPAAAPRFPQAPGGTETESIHVTPTLRGPVGGAVSVVFGNDSTGEILALRHAERHAVVETPSGAPRFSQEPGGNESQPCAEVSTATGGPVGGYSTIVLGSDSTRDLLIQRQADREAPIDTPCAVPRFSQAPGGDESIAADFSVTARGEVGGMSSVVLGCESIKEVFDEREAGRMAVVATPEAAPRFTQAPGGTESSGAYKLVSTRGPVGGATNIVLGAESAKDVFELHAADRKVDFDTPAPIPRFTQAPGGAESEPAADTLLERGPVGGTSTVILGIDDTKGLFEQRRVAVATPIETPIALTRFPQSTGGDATIVLGGDGGSVRERASKQILQAPGGQSVISIDTGVQVQESFGLGSQKRACKTVTQAPGGKSTICLGTDDLSEAEKVSANRFANGSNQNCGNTITDRSTTRLNQAPGGNSSLRLGTVAEDVFGNENVDEANLPQDPKRKATSKKIQQAPGGNATVLLG